MQYYIKFFIKYMQNIKKLLPVPQPETNRRSRRRKTPAPPNDGSRCKLQIRFRLYRDVGIGLLDKSLQYAARSEFGEIGETVGNHVADDVCPAYRSGELGDKVLFDFLGVGMRLGIHILVD